MVKKGVARGFHDGEAVVEWLEAQRRIEVQRGVVLDIGVHVHADRIPGAQPLQGVDHECTGATAPPGRRKDSQALDVTRVVGATGEAIADVARHGSHDADPEPTRPTGSAEVCVLCGVDGVGQRRMIHRPFVAESGQIDAHRIVHAHPTDSPTFFNVLRRPRLQTATQQDQLLSDREPTFGEIVGDCRPDGIGANALVARRCDGIGPLTHQVDRDPGVGLVTALQSEGSGGVVVWP